MSASLPEQKMDRVSIKIKLEGGPLYELSSPTYEQVSNEVFRLSRQNKSCKIEGSPLKFEIPAFGRTHMLVETPVEDGTTRDVVVYGVKCLEDAKMSPEQVAKRVDEVFGVDVHESITAMKTPDTVSADGSDGSTYPCGTLFTSGTHSTSSSYSPSPLPPTHVYPHTPTPSQRPGHLPIHVESHLTTPKPVATMNRNCRSDALVAGTGSYNVPADNVNEDSVLANIQCRKAPAEGPIAIHPGLEPVQKAERQHAGGTTLMGVINLETPSQNMPYSDLNSPAYPFIQPKIQLKVEDSEPRTPDQVAVEISSEESEERLAKQSECGLVAENCDKKALSNQLVVGIGKQRTISMGSVEPVGLAPPTFGRQLSLPGEKRETQQLPHRNSSQSDLHVRSSSDLGLNLEVSPCELDEAPKDTPLSPGHTPATPTKPLAIQRQESVAAPEQNEFVMPRPVNVVLCDNSQAANACLTVLEPPAFKMADEIKEEPSTKESSGQNEEGGAFKLLEVIDKQAATPTDEGSDSDQQLPLSDLMQQVHLLEHAMNDYCFLKDECKTLTRESTEFKQAVEQMKCMIEDARNGTQDQDLKEYIREHCRKCRDKDCKIPHIWAGCPPASMTISGTVTGTEATDSPHYQPSESDSSYQPSPYHQPATVSFDRIANQSTTSAVQRHFEQKCTISDIQPVNYGPSPPDSPKDIHVTDNGPIQPAEQDQTAPFSPLLNQRRIHGNPPRMVPNTMCVPSVQKQFAADQQRSGALTPMCSGGFNLPGARPERGTQYQESQLGAENYHQQVSDKGHSELRPGEREQIRYQYIEPSRSGGGLRNMYQRTENKFFTVAAGSFPAHRQLPWKPGTLIYASKDGELVPGVYSYPNNVPDRDWLGKGGNGTVVKFFLGGTEYALKMTSYREGELNTWSLLQHRNILPLLGVMLGEHGRCYQFMPRMTGDLRSMLIDHGDLRSHLVKQPEHWDVVSKNCVYVLTEVVNGLLYLHRENIQHSDVKANNILIKKKCTCPDLLHCDCTGESKYDVKIADFDSLKKTQFSRKADKFSEVCRSHMNDYQMNSVKGTPAYRAPEQFKLCPARMEFKKTLQDGTVCHDMEGPWCDMWSLGVIVLQMVLGSHNKGPYISEASILTNCAANKMHPKIESSVAQVRLIELQDLSDTHPELKPFAKVARECLKIDCRNRATADSVLKLLQSVSK